MKCMIPLLYFSINFFLLEKKKNVLEFRVALGYRDSIKGPWKKKTTGNISRILTCGYNKDMEVKSDQMSPITALVQYNWKKNL